MFNFFKNLFSKKQREIDDSIYWQNAVYAVLTYINHENHNLVGGLEKNKFNSKDMKNRLLKWWSVNNRQELIDMIESLKEDGHNKQFVETVLDFEIPKYIYKEEFIKEALPYAKKGYEDLVLMIYDIWQKDRKSKSEPIIAWDLTRAIYLCHAGYIADYFEYTEALDMALEIALVLQSKFDSWDQMFESYLDGYQYWSNELATDTSTDAYRRVKIYERLKTIEDSPYSLDWNLELKKVW